MSGSTLGFPHYGFSSLAPDPFHAKARSREGKALDPSGGTIVLIVFGSWREQLGTTALHCGPLWYDSLCRERLRDSCPVTREQSHAKTRRREG
jgi:hypothetical protein